MDHGPRTFCFQRITRCFRLRHIYDAMHIERNLLTRCRPVLITEAVDVFAVVFGLKAVIAGGDGELVDFVAVRRILDL